MNKRIAFLTVGIAIAIPLSGVFAQTSVAVKPTTEEIGQKRAELQTRKEELAQNAEQKRVEIQTRKEEMQAEMAELKAQRKENREQWCKNVQSRINNRIGRYENNQAMYQNVYANMTSRLSRLSEMLADKGADVTKLNTDLATLASLISKLDSDYAAFIAGLKETESVTCGQSDGEFKKQLGEARDVLPIIKTDRQAIKDFYQGTIKVELQTIRQALATLNPEEEEADEIEEPKEAGFNSPNPALQNSQKPVDDNK